MAKRGAPPIPKKYKRRDHSLTLYLLADELKAIEHMANKAGQSASETCRQILRDMLGLGPTPKVTRQRLPVDKIALTPGPRVGSVVRA